AFKFHGAVRRTQMIDSLPPSIALSAQQREALELIMEELRGLEDPDWPPRVILLWSEGFSQSDAATHLGLNEEAVERLRRRWLSAAGEIDLAEARATKAFTIFFSLVCETLRQEAPTAAMPHSTAHTTENQATQVQGSESNELRSATKALIEIIHHQP